MDALSDVLRVAHLTGGVFLHADFFAPWCMAARVAPEHCAPALGPASHLILYHYVVEGELRIRVDGEDGEGLVLEPVTSFCCRATTCTWWVNASNIVAICCSQLSNRRD